MLGTIIEYNGFYIEYNFYGQNEYSVQFCGDDFLFKTRDEAIKFCDDINKGE